MRGDSHNPFMIRHRTVERVVLVAGHGTFQIANQVIRRTARPTAEANIHHAAAKPPPEARNRRLFPIHPQQRAEASVEIAFHNRGIKPFPVPVRRGEIARGLAFAVHADERGENAIGQLRKRKRGIMRREHRVRALLRRVPNPEFAGLHLFRVNIPRDQKHARIRANGMYAQRERVDVRGEARIVQLWRDISDSSCLRVLPRGNAAEEHRLIVAPEVGVQAVVVLHAGIHQRQARRMLQRKAQDRIHQRRRGYEQEPRIARLGTEQIIGVFAILQIQHAGVDLFPKLRLHGKPPLLMRAEPAVLRAFARIGKHDLRVAMRAEKPGKKRWFRRFRVFFEHHARRRRMFEQIQLRLEGQDARDQLVGQDVHREAEHVQVFQEGVAQRERATRAQIGALKAGVEAVEIRLVQRRVKLGNQPLLNAIEPLVLARFGELDVRKHALFAVGKERIVALDGGIVFVPLRNQADDLRLKRACLEVFEHAHALVSLGDIILPEVFVDADGIANSALQVRLAQVDPLVGKLRVGAQQRHKVMGKRVGAACLIGARNAVERDRPHGLIDNREHAVFLALCMNHGQQPAFSACAAQGKLF